MSMADQESNQEPVGLDPYIDWALQSRRSYSVTLERGDDWHFVLIRLNGISVHDFARGIGLFDDDESVRRWQHLIRVSPLYTASSAAPYVTTFCTAMVREDFFSLVEENTKLRSVIGGIALGAPLAPEALPSGTIDATS